MKAIKRIISKINGEEKVIAETFAKNEVFYKMNCENYDNIDYNAANIIYNEDGIIIEQPELVSFDSLYRNTRRIYIKADDIQKIFDKYVKNTAVMQ